MPRTIGIMLAVTAALYLVSLGNAISASDAPMGRTDAVLLSAGGLWFALTCLCTLAGAVNGIPRWAQAAGIVLLPLAAAGSFAGLDLFSRQEVWAIAVPILLPLVIALWAAWPWLPRLHGALSLAPMSVLAWGGVVAFQALRC